MRLWQHISDSPLSSLSVSSCTFCFSVWLSAIDYLHFCITKGSQLWTAFRIKKKQQINYWSTAWFPQYLLVTYAVYYWIIIFKAISKVAQAHVILCHWIPSVWYQTVISRAVILPITQCNLHSFLPLFYYGNARIAT
mgnify:CR=1 FL=1